MECRRVGVCVWEDGGSLTESRGGVWEVLCVEVVGCVCV